MADIFTVLSTLREEVDVLEREIQTVEAALLADPDNKVLNRKYARLADEKKNKENRRERLEQQLTGQATPRVPPPDIQNFAEHAWGMPAWQLEKPGFVELPVAFGRFGPQIYVRACYLSLWGWIQQQQSRPGSEFRGCVITGNPGIGKSYFLAFALTMLLQQKKQVLWQSQFTAGEQYWWLFEEGGVRELTPTEARLVLQQGGVHYLSDGTNPAVDGNMKPILALVAHSPDADAYKQLWRQVPGFMHTPAVLPPWETLDELLRLQPLHPHVSRAQVEERFRKRGGVPRVVYDGGEDVLDPTQGDLGLALDNMDFTEVLRASSAISRFSAKASHQLILLNVPDWRKGDWRRCTVNIASPWIAELIWDRSITQAGAFANTFALMSNDISKGFKAFLGDLWEAAWHKIPATLPDKEFTVRLLLAQPSVPPGRKPKGYVSPAAAFAPTSSTRFNFFPSNYASFAALEDIPRLDLPRDMYLRPSWGSLPGLDSFRLAGDLFQLTRSSVKAPMTDALLRVLAVLPEEAVPRLYIVVPNRTIFDDWVAPIPLRTLEDAPAATRKFVEKQKAKEKVERMLQTMEQYVMLGWDDVDETLQALSKQRPSRDLQVIPLPPSQPTRCSSGSVSSSGRRGMSGRSTNPGPSACLHHGGGNSGSRHAGRSGRDVRPWPSSLELRARLTKRPGMQCEQRQCPPGVLGRPATVQGGLCGRLC